MVKNALTEYLNEKEITVTKEIKKTFCASHGVFITLNKEKHLRGCIGCIESDKPLYQEVINNVISAGVSDPRFPSVTLNQLEALNIEISILSKLEISDFEYLKENKEGVVIKNGPYQATYLPSVWRQFKNKKQFLESLSKKAGLRPDAYMDKNTQFFTYEAVTFSEEDFK